MLQPRRYDGLEGDPLDFEAAVDRLTSGLVDAVTSRPEYKVTAVRIRALHPLG